MIYAHSIIKSVNKRHKFQSRRKNIAFPNAFSILGDPGAVSRVDKMFVVKVYFHYKHFIDPTNCPWVSEDGFFKIEPCLLWDIEGQYMM